MDNTSKRIQVIAAYWDGTISGFISIVTKLGLSITNRSFIYKFNDNIRINTKDLSKTKYIRVEYLINNIWKRIDVMPFSWFIIDSEKLVTLKDSDFRRLYNSNDPNFIFRENVN